MLKPTAKYIAAMAAVVILFYWKTLLTDQFTIIVGTEGVNQFYAWTHYWLQALRHGRFALWDPYQFGGAPFAATLQPAAFYPLQLMFALWPLTKDGVVSPRLFHEYLALAHLLGAIFGYALLREMLRSRFASFLGGCVFALSGFIVRIIWPEYIQSCIWMPAILLFFLRAQRAERRHRILLESGLCGVCLALAIFSGGMAFFIMQAICVAGAALWLAVVRRSWTRPAWTLAIAFAIGVGLSAVQLIPANELSKLTLRFIDGGTYPTAKKIPFDRMVPGMWPQSLLTALIPTAFDGKIGGEETFPFYVGVMPLFLGLIAIWQCWKNLWVRYFTVLAILSFAYSLGEMSPLYGVLYAIAPLLWVTRAADRFFYLISFALAILCAFGVDALFDAGAREGIWFRVKPLVKWIALAAGAAYAIPGIVTTVNLSIWSAFSLLLIVASCGCLALLLTRSPGQGARLMLSALIFFDLAAFNWVELDNNQTARGGGQVEQMISLRGAADFIHKQPGLYRVRVGVEPAPNVGDIYGIENIWGGSATVLQEYSDLGQRDDLMNVGYLIRPAEAPEPGAIYQDVKWKVYRRSDAFPRAWLVHKSERVASEADAYGRLDSQNLREVAIVNNAVSVEPGDASVESVQYRLWGPESFTIDVNSSSKALLVLSEMYYPGWKAMVNGKSVPVHRVDGALRGIEMSPGKNRVEMEYAPGSFRVGAIISLLTLVSFVGGVLALRRADRSFIVRAEFAAVRG